MVADVIPTAETKRVDTLNAPACPSVWVVRADRGQYLNRFVSGGYAAVGWRIDLTAVGSPQALRERYEAETPATNPHQVGAAVSQLESFWQMKEGDYVITPEEDTRWLRYGRVAGPCFYAVGSDGCPYRNRRRVKWAVERLERHVLSEPLQNTLGTPKSVFAVRHREEFFEAVGASTADAAEPTKARISRRLTKREEEEGVERELGDPDSEHIDSPFDPSKIRVRTTTLVVQQVVSRVRHEEIDLAPDFQRLRGIWNFVDKSRLIESLLLRIPIPVFYVAADEQDNWQVVDGVQRISTMTDYVEGVFSLKQLEYLDHFDGKYFADLPRSMQRRIDETQLTVNVIEPGTPQEVMFNIFHRINTGGLALNGQEIRNALHPGPVRSYLATLAEGDEFLSATKRKISPRRMADRECVLRFMAFHMEPWESYSAGSLDGHLGAAMRQLNSMDAGRREALAADFRRAMRAAEAIFGRWAFRKRYAADEDWLRPISKPLFETWSVQLARCSPIQIDWLIDHRDEVQKLAMALLSEDPEFEKAISLSTGTPQRIKKRFAAIRDLVVDALPC